MRIYLDNCCFNRPFDDQTQLRINLETEAKLFIQKEILRGTYELVWSYILDFENNQNPFDLRKNTIRKWKEVACFDIEETSEIIDKAKRILSAGIKTKDALHLSCAIIADCKYFITTDTKIVKKQIEGITILDPIGFIREGEDDWNDE